MNQKLFQAKSFLNYWLDAVDEHALQSPFFFKLYKHISDRSSPLDVIENQRRALLASDSTIDVEDLGGGSALFKGKLRKVSDIARTSLSPLKYSLLYRQLIQYFNAKTVIELGTSLGMNTLYMAHALDCTVYTFEGSESIANIASSQISETHSDNVILIRGNIDITLPALLSTIDKVDFALIDANHRYAPTMKYFEALLAKSHQHTVLVMDDIYYSQEMTRAWNEIKNHKRISASVDLFRCGLLFLDTSLSRQHFVLKF